MPKANDHQKLQTALSLHQRGNLQEAANLYRVLINKNQNNFHALHFLGVIEAGFGNYEQAKLLMARSLAIQPPNIQFVENYAAILFQIGDYNSALQISQKSLQLNNNNISLLYVSAVSLLKLNKWQESLTQFDKLLLLQPNHIVALNERGSVLAELRQYDTALASVEKALTLNPQYAEAHLNKGNLYSELKRYGEAFAAYDKALSLKPDLIDAWLGRGNVFCELKRHDEAVAAYDKALTLKPDFAKALLGSGNVFFDLKRYDEAFAAYDKAFAIKPDLRGAAGLRLHTKMHLCDWSNFDAECAHLTSSIKNGNVYTRPFDILAIPSSSEDQLQCAKLWIAEKNPPSKNPIWQNERYDHDRIRVGYVSADLREHPVAFLMAGMFECHDRSRFEVTALSCGRDDNSEMWRRLNASFEHFIDATVYDDDQLAKLIKELEIDILVDLMGFTAGSRTGIFARRSAPVQVNYLGYAGTMGAQYIDYIIADRIVIPESQQDFYSEKIVCLPNSFLPTDRKRPIADKMFTRAEVGLPQEGFVFCCFNTNYKITPDVFDIWMRILKHVDGSVLWLFAESPTVIRNLRSEAAARGINAEQLIFAPLMSLPEHQARLRLADLFLDTLHYNAGATASDTLWAGLPVLTHLGETFVGRMAASALNAIGLPELITTTPEAYEAMAIDLASNQDKLGAIKQKLAGNRLATPLFDTALFTKHMEKAFAAMNERYRAGLAPVHLAILK
jgi:protein O-GlcNAc transferase